MPKNKSTSNFETLYTLYGLRVTDEPISEGQSETVDDLIYDFTEQLSTRRFPSDFGAKLEQAIADYPELPEFRNFRIVYLSDSGRDEEAMQASRDLIRDFPDYLFARTGLAQMLIHRNELAEAEALLGSPKHIETLEGKREVYHESEVHAYYTAVILLALAQDDTDLANECLPILILTRPEHPITRHMATLLRKQIVLSRERVWAHDEEYERTVESFPTVEYEKTEELPTLHHPELEVFYHTEPEDIDAETMATIRALPRATLRADLEAILKDSIQRFEYFRDTDLEEEEYKAPLHAFYWLCALQMEESLPLVLDWLRQGEEFVYFWTYESLIDVLFDSIYPIAKNRLPELLAYTQEPSQCDGSRSLVATVVAKIGVEEKARREEAVAWFREVARHTVANIDNDDLIDTDFLATWILYVIDFQGTELWPEIQELYALNLIPWEPAGELKQIKAYIFDSPHVKETVGNYSMSLVRSYGKGSVSDEVNLIQRINSNPLFTKMQIVQNYTNELFRNIDTHNKLSKNLKPLPKPAPKPMLKPPPKPQYQTPLNAPCPCGSGKKFKRCHGKE